MKKTKKDKIVDLNQYKFDKEFDDELFDELLNLSEEELDDLYKDITFGDGLNDDALNGAALLNDIKSLEEAVNATYQGWNNLSEKGWTNLEARPHLATKMELATLYKQNGLYEKALEIFAGIYKEDPNDNLGCRYEIMALYVLKSDYMLAQILFMSNPEHEDDVLMLVPFLVASILVGENSIAEQLIETLCDKVPGFLDFCIRDSFPLPQILDAGALEHYQPNSMESLYLAFYNVLPLLMTASTYVQAYLNKYFSEDESYMEEDYDLEDLDILSSAQLMSLADYGIRTIEDMANYSVKELLSIPKIGKITLEKLKEVGVRFRK